MNQVIFWGIRFPSPSLLQTCGRGVFSAPGSSGCGPCPAGRFGDEEGLGECRACPRGRYGPSQGSLSGHTCASPKLSLVEAGAPLNVVLGMGWFHPRTKLYGSPAEL